jgi:hypothetical protein
MKRDYGAGMVTNRKQSGPTGFDAQAGALLDRTHESASIVDSLMAMPLPDDGDGPRTWNSAVAQRLERRLADAMRDRIEGDPDKKDG